MTREDMINTTRAILARAGFDVSSAINIRSISFDVVGRRGDRLLIVKVLANVDALTRQNAEELKTLAEALGASPLLIGEASSSGPLEKGIVYTRFKIPILSNETLADELLEEVPPFIFAAPGGLYVRIDGDVLRDFRERTGTSLGALADAAGVSRRTIQMYEDGMGAIIDAALRLEEYAGIPLIAPVDPFGYRPDEKRSGEVSRKSGGATGSAQLDKMVNIGFAITPLTRGPFDAITRDDENSLVLLTGVGGTEQRILQKALIASELSKLSGRHSFVIVQKRQRQENIESTALVTDEELKRIDDKDVLTDIILSRSTKR